MSQHTALSSTQLPQNHLPAARRRTARRIGIAAVGAGLALTLTACGSSSTTGSASPAGPASAAGSTAQLHNAADVTFAQSMIRHHQQAVEMAKMGATEAASPAVKQLAGQIQAAQDPEIHTMTGWLTAWGQPVAMPGMDMTGHGMSASPGMSAMPGMSASPGMGAMPGMSASPGMATMPGMMSDADMTRLGALSGPAFDREFLTMMTAHHTGAIEMARTELAQGQSQPAKDLATSIIADQTAEIAKMKTLLTQV